MLQQPVLEKPVEQSLFFASDNVTITAGQAGSGSDSADDIGGGNGQNQNNGDDGQGIRPGTNGNCTVYGNLTLPCDITIPNGATVTIPQDASLTVPQGTTLTNNGTIQKDGGSFINDGTVTGQQPADDRYSINYADETITIAEGYALYDAETGGNTIIAAGAERTASITTYISDYNSTTKTLYLQAPAAEGENPPDRRAITIPARPAAPTVNATINYANEKLSFPPGVTATALEYALSQSDSN